MQNKYVIGIDVGGQSAKLGIVDHQGNILDRLVIRTNGTSDAGEFLTALADAVNTLIKNAGVEGEVKGIGVGAPNGNYYTGEIAFAPNVLWARDGSVPFSKMLNEKTGLPVTLTNDANAAAMGEMTYGVARGMKDFIMITLGTGVGSGIVIDGKVVYGHDGLAGELGHVCSVRDGRQCGCGKKGCLEAYCSAIGVQRTAIEWLETTDEPSTLRTKYNEVNPLTIYRAAKDDNDALSIRVFEYMGQLMGESLANFVTFSAPEAIVFFGGLTHSREFFEKKIEDTMNENLLPIWKNKVKILFSSLNESDAAILGASALAW